MGFDYSVFRDVPGFLHKPEPRARTKRRAERVERKTKTQVRQECAERDGYCRIAEMMRDRCHGRSELMHLEHKRRCFTRGMAPTERHDRRFSCMGCSHHHQQYDRHLFDVHFIDEEKGADGPLEIRWRA